MTKPECPECGSDDVTTTMENESIPYGQGSDKAEIACETPVRHCNKCHFNWLDNTGMTAHMLAVFKHEKNKGVFRTKFCNDHEKELWDQA